MNRLRTFTGFVPPVLFALATAAAEPTAPSPQRIAVPFAIPAAVPVAVVQKPTLFYAVTRYVPQHAVEAGPPQPDEVAASAELRPNDDPAVREQVARLLERRCAECHRGAQARGDVVLFDDGGRLLDKLPRHTIAAVVQSAPGEATAMPPAGREPLASDERNLLQRWARLPKSFAY